MIGAERRERKRGNERGREKREKEEWERQKGDKTKDSLSGER